MHIFTLTAALSPMRPVPKFRSPSDRQLVDIAHIGVRCSHANVRHTGYPIAHPADCLAPATSGLPENLVRPQDSELAPYCKSHSGLGPRNSTMTAERWTAAGMRAAGPDPGDRASANGYARKESTCP